MNKFNCGDRVLIKSNLEPEKTYNGVCFVSNMKKYTGKTAIITRVQGEVEYELNIDEGRWTWSDDMLELIGKYINLIQIYNSFNTEFVLHSSVLGDIMIRSIDESNVDYPIITTILDLDEEICLTSDGKYNKSAEKSIFDI